MRLCIVAGELSAPFDEGTKNFVRSSATALARDNPVLRLATEDGCAHPNWVERFNRNRMFLNRSLLRRVKDFCPQAVLYIPSSSATLLGFLRSRLLKSHCTGAKVVLIALQPRRYSFITRNLITLAKPDLVLTQSRSFLEELSGLGCPTEFLPSGVDLSRFHPVGTKAKLQLRRKYRLETQKFLILHVGHINRNRNVQALKEIPNAHNQVLLVGRRSVCQDRALIEELRGASIRILTDYLHNIEELYQLSDCYVFPVVSRDAAIQIPLSVLEAMASNLPVITTRYGGLTSLFKEGSGLHFLDHPGQLAEKVQQAKRASRTGTRALVQPFSWQRVAETILEKVASSK